MTTPNANPGLPGVDQFLASLPALRAAVRAGNPGLEQYDDGVIDAVKAHYAATDAYGPKFRAVLGDPQKFAEAKAIFDDAVADETTDEARSVRAQALADSV
jgi:hypothetical protein